MFKTRTSRTVLGWIAGSAILYTISLLMFMACGADFINANLSNFLLIVIISALFAVMLGFMRFIEWYDDWLNKESIHIKVRRTKQILFNTTVGVIVWIAAVLIMWIPGNQSFLASVTFFTAIYTSILLITAFVHLFARGFVLFLDWIKKGQ